MDVFAKLLGTIEVGDNIVACDPKFISRDEIFTYKFITDMYPGMYDVYAIYGTRGEHKGKIVALTIRGDGYGFEFQRDHVIESIPIETEKVGFFAPSLTEKEINDEIGNEDNGLLEKGIVVKPCQDHAPLCPVSIDREIDGRIRGLIIDFLVSEENYGFYIPDYEVLDFLEPHINVDDLDVSEYTDQYDQEEELPSEYEERLDFC